MHGNPSLILPPDHAGGCAALIREPGDDVVWESHMVPAGTDALRADVWHGRFLGDEAGGAVLPAGTYRVRWRPVEGADRELGSIEVVASVVFDEPCAAGTTPESTGWVSHGAWSPEAGGWAARDRPSFLFREAAMHGTLTARFALPAQAPPGTRWGLIARHYNAEAHLRVVAEAASSGWSLRLERVWAGREPDVLILGKRRFPAAPPAVCELTWELNGCVHAVRLSGDAPMTAREDFMGGVDVVGVFATRGVALRSTAMHTTQSVPVATVTRDAYTARIRPGNIRHLSLTRSASPEQNIFWESGLQFGHVGGSEVKFTQGATQHRTAAGPVATVVEWLGPMPKMVDQSHDVRGFAWGRASFYPDRVVIADDVLVWVRRSVGPDVDLFGPLLASPARLAYVGQRAFRDWPLPPGGRHAKPDPVEGATPFPLVALFPLNLGGSTWWLEAVIDLRYPDAATAPHAIFGWQCAHGLTASHDFRVSPTEPGRAYGFSIVLGWHAPATREQAERDALNLRDDWVTPMRLTARTGQLVRYEGVAEHPREAISFDGCFDRASGRYTLRADAGRVTVDLDPRAIPRRAFGLTVHGLPADGPWACRLDRTPLIRGRDYHVQQAPDGACWLWVERAVSAPATLMITSEQEDDSR